MAIEINVGAGNESVLIGETINLSTPLDGVFVWEDSTWARNNQIVTDTNDLDPSLQPLRQYIPSGGQDTFAFGLGTTAAIPSQNVVAIFRNGTAFLRRSADNGDSYASVTASGVTFVANRRDCANVSPTTNTGICCTSNAGGRIARTTDSFVSFTLIAPGPAVTPTSVFCDSNGDWYLGFNGGQIYRSVAASDGVSWSSVTTLSGAVTSITQGASGRLVAGTTTGDVSYSDNGTTWTSATSTAGDVRAISFVGTNAGSDILIAVSGTVGGNKISTDNGENWTQFNGFSDIGDGVSYLCWSNGLGRLVIVVSDNNYDGTKDRVIILNSNNFASTLVQSGTLETSNASGLSVGSNIRLFLSSSNYDASDQSEPYSSLDFGFKPRGEDSNTLQATLIKRST